MQMKEDNRENGVKMDERKEVISKDDDDDGKKTKEYERGKK